MHATTASCTFILGCRGSTYAVLPSLSLLNKFCRRTFSSLTSFCPSSHAESRVTAASVAIVIRWTSIVSAGELCPCLRYSSNKREPLPSVGYRGWRTIASSQWRRFVRESLGEANAANVGRAVLCLKGRRVKLPMTIISSPESDQGEARAERCKL